MTKRKEPRAARLPNTIPDVSDKMKVIASKFHNASMSLQQIEAYINNYEEQLPASERVPVPTYKTIQRIIVRMCNEENGGILINEHDFMNERGEWCVSPSIHGEFACLLLSNKFGEGKKRKNLESLYSGYGQLIHGIESLLCDEEKDFIKSHPLYHAAVKEKSISDVLIKKTENLLAALYSFDARSRIGFMNDVIKEIDAIAECMFLQETINDASQAGMPVVNYNGKVIDLIGNASTTNIRCNSLEDLLFEIMKAKIKGVWPPPNEVFEGEECYTDVTISYFQRLQKLDEECSRYEKYELTSQERYKRNREICNSLASLLNTNDDYEYLLYQRIVAIIMKDEIGIEHIASKEIDHSNIIRNNPYNSYEIIKELINFRNKEMKEGE